MFSYLYSTAVLSLTEIHKGILAFFKVKGEGKKKKCPLLHALQDICFRRGFSVGNSKSNVDTFPLPRVRPLSLWEVWKLRHNLDGTVSVGQEGVPSQTMVCKTIQKCHMIYHRARSWHFQYCNLSPQSVLVPAKRVCESHSTASRSTDTIKLLQLKKLIVSWASVINTELFLCARPVFFF